MIPTIFIEYNPSPEHAIYPSVTCHLLSDLFENNAPEYFNIILHYNKIPKPKWVTLIGLEKDIYFLRNWFYLSSASSRKNLIKSIPEINQVIRLLKFASLYRVVELQENIVEALFMLNKKKWASFLLCLFVASDEDIVTEQEEVQCIINIVILDMLKRGEINIDFFIKSTENIQEVFNFLV